MEYLLLTIGLSHAWLQESTDAVIVDARLWNCCQKSSPLLRNAVTDHLQQRGRNVTLVSELKWSTESRKEFRHCYKKNIMRAQKSDLLDLANIEGNLSTSTDPCLSIDLLVCEERFMLNEHSVVWTNELETKPFRGDFIRVKWLLSPSQRNLT